MFEYLNPKDGPVFEGLEKYETVYAKHQAQYIPLRTLVTNDDSRRATSRWTLTPQQREAVANGADIFLTLYTFGEPLQPIVMMVSDDKTVSGGPLDRSWLKGYFLDLWGSSNG